MKIIIYTFKSLPTMYVARQLIKGGKIEGVILQKPMSLAERMRFIKRRISRYGLAAVIDEILFKIYYAVFLKKRDEDLRKEYFPKDFFCADPGETGVPVYEIDSINSDEGRAILNRIRPDLVIMESREMIAEDILKIPPLGFIGCHPGIIPEYRGVYASFWAMLRGEPDKVGLSVYIADAGVDTGGIVSQRASQPKFDIRNFKVESERLMIEGVEDLRGAIESAQKGELKTYKKNSSPTRFFTHVGLSDYLKAASGCFTVLLYHGVDSGEDFYAGMNSHLKEYILTRELFENHIKYLYTNKFNVLSLDQCLEYIAKGAMPERSVILTFDDGEKSCQRTIAPILDRYGFKGEFFIVSGLIGKENYMDDNDLRELSGKDHGIQSHSVSHRPLTRLSGAQIYDEMKKSKEEIAAVTGKEAKFFSIPTGFYDKRVPDTARKIGYKALLCSVEGYNEVSGDSFLLKRFAIRSYTGVKGLINICENRILTSRKLLAKRVFTKMLKFMFTFELYDKLRDRFLKRMITIERK